MSDRPSPIRALVVMGVAGCGKTTVGRAVAARLGWAFVDADDHHPEANVAKMRRGEPLTDADRAPWLATLGGILESETRSAPGIVLACSALKRSYRRTLARCDAPNRSAPHGTASSDGLPPDDTEPTDSASDVCAPDVAFAWLDAPEHVLAERLRTRSGHFAGADLLASQLRDLEPPSETERPTAARFDASAPVDEVADAILERFAARIG